jgi:hypothetical protein
LPNGIFKVFFDDAKNTRHSEKPGQSLHTDLIRFSSGPFNKAAMQIPFDNLFADWKTDQIREPMNRALVSLSISSS